MKRTFTLMIVLFFSAITFAQNGLPTDYLTSEFHKERREALRAKIAPNTVAVFFANAERNRARSRFLLLNRL
jgi:Xaa-Pro aminopeptidase